MKDALLYDGMEYWRRETPDKVALVLDNSETLTYGELGRWSDGVAAHLMSQGVKIGDNVGISGANSIEWVVCAFAILKAGGVLVPMNERFVKGEFEYLIEFTEPCRIVADAARAQVIATTAHPPPVTAMDDIAQFRNGAPAGWRPQRAPPESLAMLIFTSGSTGRPKGVMVSHEKLLTQYFELRLFEPSIGPDLRQLMVFALQGGPGSAHGYLFATTNGGTFCFVRKFEPAAALRTIVDQKITWLAGFPILFDQIMRQPEFAAADLSSIVSASSGGARLSPVVLDAWRNKGVMLRQMYGQTEVGGYAIMGTVAEARAGKASCGRPWPFTRIKVVRPDGSTCAPGEPGQILVNGPGTMVGYWRNPDATAQTVVDGWIHTGDLGMFDEEGYLTYVDRVTDMIKTGGYNVSPSEVEGVISRFPGVVEVCVVSVPDEKFSETPAALIYATTPLDAGAIIAHCREHLANYKVPTYVIPLAEPLPRLTSGKVDKRKLRADYADTPERFSKAR